MTDIPYKNFYLSIFHPSKQEIRDVDKLNDFIGIVYIKSMNSVLTEEHCVYIELIKKISVICLQTKYNMFPNRWTVIGFKNESRKKILKEMIYQEKCRNYITVNEVGSSNIIKKIPVKDVTKKCKICNKIKIISDFYNLEGIEKKTCQLCILILKPNQKNDKPELKEGFNQFCNKCKNIKILTDFGDINNRKKKTCIDCCNKYKFSKNKNRITI